MANRGIQRSQIEDTILALSRKVDMSDARWLESDPLAEFLNGWENLAQYYRWNPDSTIDAHILKLYMRYAVALRNAFEDDQLSQRRRQRARAALGTLNGHLDTVFHHIQLSGGARTAV